MNAHQLKSLEIRDVIHGSIEIFPWELKVIDSPFFQRLRNIRQLGFSEFAYPCATHNRYVHSIGACHLAGIAFQAIFKEHLFSSPDVYHRYLYLARTAALLHDIGHGPFSHAVEFAMPPASEMKLPKEVLGDTKRLATHEDYTLKIILESSLTPLLEKGFSEHGLGIQAKHVAQVMNLALPTHDDFFRDGGIDFRKILHQIISSEIDVDRMDYLQRDSYYTGVSYGKFDSNWLIANLTCHFSGKTAHLAIKDRAIYTFEDFLLSRYHMFLMVYLHHKSVIYEEMLKKYIDSPDCTFRIPADVEQYKDFDDAALFTALRRDRKNYWAGRLLDRRIFRVALEVHGKDHSRVDELAKKLEKKKIPFVLNASGKALSSYNKPNLDGNATAIDENTIFVEVSDKLTATKWVKLQDYAEVFRRYGEERKIARVYVPEDMGDMP